MIQEIVPGLYEIKIRLEGNPLKNLNSYVFMGRGRNLLVDTGFNQKTCLKDLREGIGELGLDMEKTDIFVTHFHADHCGLVSKVAAAGSKVYMGETDYALFQRNRTDKVAFWQEYETAYRREGFPQEQITLCLKDNPAKHLADDGDVEITPLQDGDTIEAGGRVFTTVLTPGHTPGHMCLYAASSKTMALGDHILFDITPNITAWRSMPNALGHYLQSLAKIKNYNIALALPAHRQQSGKTVAQRADELLAHHHNRLDGLQAIVQQHPGLNGYEAAAYMKWSIRAKNWEDFPLSQKWFAVGEALSHLEYLVAAGRVVKQETAGENKYYLA